MMKGKQLGKHKPSKFSGVDADDGFQEAAHLNARPHPENFNLFYPPVSRAYQSLMSTFGHQTLYSYGDTNIGCKGEGSQDGPYAGDANWWGHGGQSQLQQLQPWSSYGKKPYHSEQGTYLWQPSAGILNQSIVETPHRSPSQPSSNCKTPYQPQDTSIQGQPSFLQLLLSEDDDMIDLSDNEEQVSPPPPVGSPMRSRKSGPSSGYDQPHQLPEGASPVQLSSSHPQPSHLPALIDQEVIGEHLCSQSLLESVLRCSKRGQKRCGSQMNAIEKHADLLVSTKTVTSQPSHPQAGANKEEVVVGSVQHLLFSFYKDARLIKEKAHGRPCGQNQYLEVLNCKIPIAVNKSGQPVGSEAPKLTSFHGLAGDKERMRQDDLEESARNKASRAYQKKGHAMGHDSSAQVHEDKCLKKSGGKAPSQAKLCIKTRTTIDGRPANEPDLLEQAAEQQASKSCGTGSDVFTQVMGQDRYVSTHGPSSTEAEAMEMIFLATAEVKVLRERVASIEQTCAEMASEMRIMMSMIKDLQKNLGDKEGAPPKP